MAVVTASSGMAMGRTSSNLKARLPSSYSSLYTPSSSSSSSLKNNKGEMASQLGFLSSQFSGLRISFDDQIGNVKPISAPFRSPIQPVARRVCPFTGKRSNNKNLVSHSNHKTKTLQFPNLQKKRLWWEEGRRFVKLRLSTKALKTIEKHGLDAMAKKAGIELAKNPCQ